MLTKFIVQIVILSMIISLHYISLHGESDMDFNALTEMDNDIEKPYIWLMFVTSLIIYCFCKLKLYEFALQSLKSTLQKYRKLMIMTLVPLMIASTIALNVSLLPETDVNSYLKLGIDDTGIKSILQNNKDILKDKLAVFFQTNTCSLKDENNRNMFCSQNMARYENREEEIAEISIDTTEQMKSKSNVILYELNYTDGIIFPLGLFNGLQDLITDLTSTKHENSEFNITTFYSYLKPNTLVYLCLWSPIKIICLKIVKYILMMYSLCISLFIAVALSYYGIKKFYAYYLNVMELNKF